MTPRPTRVEQTVGERWLRAYAAAVGDLSAPLFDLDAEGGIVAHPVFPVCLEWPLIEHGPPGLELDAAAVHAGLHVSHEITWHRAIRPGDVLVTSIAPASLDQRSIGVLASVDFATRTREGEPVVESRQGILYLGSTLPGPPDGAERVAAGEPERPPAALRDVASFAVDAGDAVVYTECSRIWNPIHTDPRAARAAGLPDTVLHGTATLAHVVSAVVASRLDGDPTALRRLACRFTAAVSPGARVTVAASAPRPPATPGGGATVDFAARRADGTAVLERGLVELAR